MSLADDITRHSGTPWHATRKGRQAIVAAFQQFVEELPIPLTDSLEEKFTDDPSTLGRAIARIRLFPRNLGRSFVEDWMRVFKERMEP
jgi:hypothetical protein